MTKKNKTKKKLKIDQKLLKEIFKLMSEIIYFDLIRYETFFNQNKLKKKIKILIKNYYLN